MPCISSASCRKSTFTLQKLLGSSFDPQDSDLFFFFLPFFEDFLGSSIWEHISNVSGKFSESSPPHHFLHSLSRGLLSSGISPFSFSFYNFLPLVDTRREIA